ncbi:MAG: hypothetical protein M3Y27_04295 [Acidobacteriota bacterium]|nr:hypothetical protein [Acidobacteriota bacterium]
MRFLFKKRVGGTAFVHPLAPAPKTIVLAPGFESTRAIRVFPQGWNEQASRFGPCSVAAPIKELLSLAQSGITVQYAAIVLTRGPHSALSEMDRDRLWDAFGVPVFEQCLGLDNELLAMECEAHDGLHLMGTTSRVGAETSVCGCGSSVPRRMPKPQKKESFEPAWMTA